MKKKVLMISHSSLGGGAEVVFNETLQLLLKKNYDIFVILPQKDGWLYDELINNQKVKKIFILNIKKLSSKDGKKVFYRRVILKNILNFFKIFSFIKKNKIDILYINTIINFPMIIIGVILKKRVIWHLHEEYNKYENWINNSLDHIITFFYKKIEVIYISKKMKDNWEQRFGRAFNSYVIYNPIKKINRANLGIKKKNITIGFVGSFSERKNIFTLIEVIEKLQKKYNFNVKLCGKSIPKEVNNFIIEKKMIINGLELFDHIELDNFYKEISILVLPSFNEPWGLVILEAMQDAIIPVVTDQSAIKELFNDKESVFYFNPWNREELYKKIEEVINLKDDEKKRIIGNNIELLKKYKFNENYERRILDVFNK